MSENTKIINPYAEDATKKTLDDLIADAIERKDVEALKWLKTQANTTKTRKRTDGTTYEVKLSIVEIRPNYYKNFLNYKTKGALAAEAKRKKERDRKQKALDDKFADAFKALGITDSDDE